MVSLLSHVMVKASLKGHKSMHYSNTIARFWPYKQQRVFLWIQLDWWMELGDWRVFGWCYRGRGGGFEPYGCMFVIKYGQTTLNINAFKAPEGVRSLLKENLVDFLWERIPLHLKLFAHIALLKEQLLIAKFVGPKPTPHALEAMVETLHQDLNGCHLIMCMNVGKGYFCHIGVGKETLHKALMLSPYKLKRGTCMLQSWIPWFNLETLVI